MSKATLEVPAKAEEKVSPLLKMALELGPLLVFFFANLRGEWLANTFPVLSVLGGPLFIASGLFMVATVVSLVVSKIILGHLPLMPFVSGIVVIVFGVLGIWLQDDLFFKMKPTIVNTLFGIVLLGGIFFGKSLLGYVFNAAFNLDEAGWRKLTIRWGVFFLFLAVLNEIVWRGAGAWYFPDAKAANDFWVAFKVWGTMPITILFTLSQMPLIMRHSIEPPEEGKAP
ncbi:septation protein A [Shinella sp. CPCC 100929]|uniref:Inner membrane-spanning protein YciB n=1 Tax=Shinella lacus TaxID=2654216 RepID=A0ABT1RCJ7_9HYPH|nr:septation protein A [Shinella lacus]MCQ4632911.1 septation protein A [Shinella lacus]